MACAGEEDHYLLVHSDSENEDDVDPYLEKASDELQQAIENLSWFHPSLTRHQSEAILLTSGEGTFLLRRRMKGWGLYSLDVRGIKSVKHFRVTLTDAGVWIGNRLLPSVEAFEDHFLSSPILGDESGVIVQCKHKYPRTVEEFVDYQEVTCHFLMSQNRVPSEALQSEGTRVGYSAASKEGYMKKQGGMVKSWKTRWFVLKDNFLSYYTRHESKAPIRELNLEGVSRVLDSAEDGECVFRIVFPWRTFFLEAPTAVSKQEWIQALKYKVEELRKHRGQGEKNLPVSLLQEQVASIPVPIHGNHSNHGSHHSPQYSRSQST